MKTKAKSIIAGLLVGATLAGTSLLAANTITLYNVLAEGVTIVVDGKKINPTDANGNPVEPMIYNGTTYLPVRAVANAFGKAVAWDGATTTVYLGDMDGTLEKPTLSLRDTKSIGSSHYIAHNAKDNYENQYEYALKGSDTIANKGYTYEYLVNGKYSKFKTVLCVENGTSSHLTATFSVVADGTTLYTSPEMDKISKPIDVEVDISGYNDIKLVFSDSAFSDYLLIAEPGFYQ